MPIAYYGSKISPHITKTPEGYLVCHDVPINRIGVYKYLGCEIGRDSEDSEREFSVLRQPEAVFEEAALASFEGKPVTDGHPPDNVSTDNISAFGKGHAQNIRKGSGASEQFTIADLYITDPQLIDDVENGKREISCGYDYVLFPNKNGTYEQKSIRGNHIAVVDKGRAGKRVAIQDAEPIITERGKSMSKPEGSFLGRLFKIAAKDESMTPDDIEKLAGLMNAKDEGYEEPDEDDTDNAKDEGDELKALVMSLVEEVKSLKAAMAPKESEDEFDDLASEEGEEDQEGEDADEPAEQENGVTVSPEEMDKTATDSARAMAKEMKAILKRSITDPVAYKQAAKDTATKIRSMYGVKTSNDGYSEFAKKTAAASKNRAAQDAQIPAQKIIEEQQNAYNALNPHMKKEVK